MCKYIFYVPNFTLEWLKKTWLMNNILRYKVTFGEADAGLL